MAVGALYGAEEIHSGRQAVTLGSGSPWMSMLVQKQLEPRWSMLMVVN